MVLKLLEYYQTNGTKEVVPASWFALNGKHMTREQRGRMITFFVQHGRFEQAYQWLEEYGAVYVSANTILKILTELSDSEKAEDELYYRLCYGCFQNNQMNYTSLKYLAKTFLGTCAIASFAFVIMLSTCCAKSPFKSNSDNCNCNFAL